MTSRPFVLGLWIVALAALGWFVQRELVLGTDLRLFLPSPTTPGERLLLEEIGEGPASSVLVVALSGAPAAELADLSRTLADSLHDSEHFRFVSNGEMSLDAIPDDLLAYRYLLSPTLDSQPFDAAYLRTELEARARDIASPAGSFLEPWLPRDPTLELLEVLQRWQPMQEPRRDFDVWFDRDGERALLLAQTHAPAFDPERQRIAIDALTAKFSAANDDPDVKLFVSGSGQFSVLMEARTRGDAERLGMMASIGMVVLLLIGYRSLESVVLSALPLASAALTGLAAVSAFFGAVHGITLAFGFTLLGVAQDYPIHLLSHRRPDRSPAQVARGLWPTLATGVASTCIAYLTFLFSGVIGLQQLACFTVVGLAVAALTTRFALPLLMGAEVRDVGDSQFIERVWRALRRLGAPPAFMLGLAAICIAIPLLASQPLWENDLGKLTPVPADLLAQDQELRLHLGAPDIRYLLVIDAADAQQALARLEALEPQLDTLRTRGAVEGFDHAARYVPGVNTQVERQRRLPDPAELRASLQAALATSPFRATAFEAFIKDVERARQLPPLTPDDLQDAPVGATLDMLLVRREQGATALVTFSDVRDAEALQNFAASAGDDVTLLDLKAASESLVASQRERMLWTLSVGAVLLIAVVAFALRNRRRVIRVIAPMALTTLVIVAVLQASGVSMTLFHLIALILAAGLGLDYALFFEHAADDPKDQRRTLHGVALCSCSTLLVFALLATSSLPVLQAIGVTVSIGVISNFVLAMIMAGGGKRNRLEAGGWREEERQPAASPSLSGEQSPVSDSWSSYSLQPTASVPAPAPSPQPPASPESARRRSSPIKAPCACSSASSNGTTITSCWNPRRIVRRRTRYG